MNHLTLLVAACVFAAVLRRRMAGGDPASRGVWWDLGWSTLCGFVATAINLSISPSAPQARLVQLASLFDTLAAAWMAMAALRQPYQVSPWQVPRLEDRWMRPGVLIAMAAAWFYVTMQDATSMTATRMLHLTLGLYVLLRLVAEARGAQRNDHTHWFRVFCWLSLAAAAWLVARLLRGLLAPHTAPWGEPMAMVLTLVAGGALIAATFEPRPKADVMAPELWTSPRATPVRTTVHTVGFALAFPVFHVLGHATGVLPDALRVPRERIVLFALLLLGTLAFIQRTLLRRRAEALTAEHRRIEGMIRQHHTNLELSEARRNASASIRDAADRFERIFRACPSLLMIVDADDGQVLEVNESFERIAGVGRRDAVGLHAAAFGLWPHPDDPNAWTDAVRRGRTVRDRRLILTTPDGPRTVLVSAAAIELEHGQGFVILGTDVTRHEASLLETSRHAAYLEAAFVPMVVVDGDDRLASWSVGALRLFADRLDHHADDAAAQLGGRHANAWRRRLARARHNGHGVALLTAVTADDAERLVACRFTAMPDAEEQSHVLCLLTPIEGPAEGRA